MKKLIIIMAALWASTAVCGSTTLKQIDNIQNSTGGSSLSVPSTGSSFATDSNTLTFSNKSISGSSNTLTNLPASALSGQTSVANGGTGLSSVTADALLYGNGTSALQVLAIGTQYQVLQAGASAPAYDAVHLNQAAAVTGTLPVGNGGTGQSSLTAHDVLVGNGTSGITQVSPTSNTGYVLTSNGTSADPSFQAVPSMSPSLNGGSASPESVTAAGGITLTGIGYDNWVWVVGSPGAVTVTATPSITACTADGQKLHVIGTDNTKTVKLQDNASLSGSALYLNGPITLGLYQDITLHCDITLGGWVEDARNY